MISQRRYLILCLGVLIGGVAVGGLWTLLSNRTSPAFIAGGNYHRNPFGARIVKEYAKLRSMRSRDAVNALWGPYLRANRLPDWPPPERAPYRARPSPAFPVTVRLLKTALREEVIQVLYLSEEYDPYDHLNLRLYEAWKEWPASVKARTVWVVFHILSRSRSPVMAQAIYRETKGEFRAFAWGALSCFDPDAVPLDPAQIEKRGDPDECVQAASVLREWHVPTDVIWARRLYSKAALDPRWRAHCLISLQLLQTKGLLAPRPRVSKNPPVREESREQASRERFESIDYGNVRCE